MLNHDEHQAMIMFDRLLMAARDNETVADLLDQTLNVARMIDPRADDKVVYGPLQRMHFEWQQLRHQMSELNKKMENYINQQNRYGGTYNNTTYGPNVGYPTMVTSTSMWPSNPGLDVSTGSFQSGFGPTPPPIAASDINKYYNNTNINNIHHDEKIKDITHRLQKIAEAAKQEASDLKNEAK